MKRVIFMLILVPLFAGCVTTHYTKTDFEKNKGAPLGPGKAILYGLIPGLPQLVNGEYLEAAVYFTTAVTPIALSNIPGLDNNAKTALSTVGGTVCLWSLSDGIYTSYIRTGEYKKIDKENYDRQLSVVAKQENDARADRMKSYTLEEQSAILSGKLFVGMSKGALLECKGLPEQVNKLTNANGEYEQFVYNNATAQKKFYVYVENGKVTAWQE